MEESKRVRVCQVYLKLLMSRLYRLMKIMKIFFITNPGHVSTQKTKQHTCLTHVDCISSRQTQFGNNVLQCQQYVLFTAKAYVKSFSYSGLQ
jgi:hypothetical protein